MSASIKVVTWSISQIRWHKLSEATVFLLQLRRVTTPLPVTSRMLVWSKTTWSDRRDLSPRLKGKRSRLRADESSEEPQQLLWPGQFLKAPQRLARQKKSFSRFPSTCQKAAVCVTPVRWFTQNLKQNCSRSCGTKGEEKCNSSTCIVPTLKYALCEVHWVKVRRVVNIWKVFSWRCFRERREYGTESFRKFWNRLSIIFTWIT